MYITDPRTRALSSLVQQAKAGGYTLPADVTDAYETWRRLESAELPPPVAFDAGALAARILAAAEAGQPIQPLDWCRSALEAEQDAVIRRHANEGLTTATVTAASNAVNTAADTAEEILRNHLQPAFTALLQDIRAAAALLQPWTDQATFALDMDGLFVNAPDKIRKAYTGLRGLGDRMRLLRNARELVGALAPEERLQDNQFVVFEHPEAFHPGWRLPAPLPRIPSPKDPMAHLLWLGSEAVAEAGPWLPTAAQQSAAWHAVFGAATENARVRAEAGRHLGGVYAAN